ncbi:tudor domain-containing protein 1-like [Lytechinus pictus]|uniref:tudor domain-containing protein 1-like n=1 Tax=Lytechinus pictus TaxID=7653 RepID=UPI0030B9F66C
MDNWHPMADDYANHSFNSYNKGPASGLSGNGASRNGPRRFRLFVNGLPKEMTTKGLENLFSSVATVTDCFVKASDKPHTYGFVNVGTAKEVENAIRKLDGHQIKDTCIKVAMAREGPSEHSNRDGGRPFRPSPGGDTRETMRPPSHSAPSSMNNGIPVNGFAKGVDDKAPQSNRSPAQQTSPMSSMVTAGCEECQRLLMALMTHMQQNHSQGQNQGGGKQEAASTVSRDVTSPANGRSSSLPYNGPGTRIHRANDDANQRQVNSLPTRGRSPAERSQGQSFASPTGSAFSKPSPTKIKSLDVKKPTPVPKEQDAQNQSPPKAKSPRRTSERKAESDLKPCEACGKSGSKHCSKCGAPYCSVVCQKGDWKKHKNRCKPSQSSGDQKDTGASPPALSSLNLKYVEPSKKEMRVVLTHKNNPGSFWVQVGDEENVTLYNKMLKLLMEQVQASGPLQDPKPGMMCISKYAVDDSWYRATIQTINKERVATVFMLDFGNTEVVPFNDLRPALPEIVEFPVFGLHCAIADVEPRGSSGKWCYDSVKLMDKLMEECPLPTVRFEGKKAGIHQVVMNVEDKKLGTVSVGDALIKQELAWPKGRQAAPPPRKVLLKSSMKRLEMPSGSEPVRIAINNYVNPREMQCQVITPESLKAIEEMSGALNSCMEGKSQPPGFTPMLGEVCAGRFTQDDQWYRVSIQSAKMDGGYFVEYLDFGNTEVLDPARMCPLPTQFHNTPQQSFVASFADLPAGDISQDLSQATMQRLSQCKEGFFLATFTEKKDDTIFMNLQDPNTNENIAEAVGLVQPKVKAPKGSDMTFRTLPLNKDTEFVITEAVSPGEFYGFSPSDAESTQILGMVAEGGKEVSSQPAVQNFRPGAGNVCWAQFSEDKDWYRAAILQELPDDEFDVQYIDYGNGEKVHLSLMRPISDDIVAVPILGIRCCIAGLPNDNGQRSEEINNTLKEMTGVGSKKIILRAIEHRNNVTYVELEDPATGLNISQEIINLVKEASGVEPSEVSGPSSLSSHPSIGESPRGQQQQQKQPRTPNQPRSAPVIALSPEQLQTMQEQMAMLQAQLDMAKGMSA